MPGASAADPRPFGLPDGDPDGDRRLLKFGLFGVAGHNRGDDAISLSVIAGLRQTFGVCDILVAILKGGQTGLGAADRTVTVDRRSMSGLWALLRAINSVDVVLLGGGSLIQDRLGGSRIKGVIGYAWTITGMARLLNKPVYTVPMGIDELKTERAIGVAREVLRHVRWVALRDRSSLAELRRIGGPAETAAVFCDPVFGWTPAIAPPDEANSVVFTPAFEGVDDDVIAEIFASLAVELVRSDPSRRITILAMDSRAETDGGKLHEIFDRLPPHVQEKTAMSVPATAEAAASLIRNAQAVVAMRLHAIILSYGYTKCFCLSRTTKTAALLHEFQVDGVEYGGMPVDDVVRRAAASVSDSSRLASQKANLARLQAVSSTYYPLLKQRLENDGILDRADVA